MKTEYLLEDERLKFAALRCMLCDQDETIALFAERLAELRESLREIQMYAIHGCGTKQKDVRGKQFGAIVDICSKHVDPLPDPPKEEV